MRYVFLDTNILIYTFSEDEPDKRAVSNKILLEENCLVSTQVINELSNILYKKFNIGYRDALNVVDEVLTIVNITQVNIETVNIETIKKAHFIKHKYKYSYYDSLIISSALENRCEVLYSEDMQHKQIIENETVIINPFESKI
ncbi:PIN domain-containing protein [Persephonella sp.]|uniref:PIN domain-containing protein n=1 Tax=Persephonella sp. TaxID=2060922 RepID=UPI0025E4D1C9|nr:PIN domain-containing protein [Persephonella sp.]